MDRGKNREKCREVVGERQEENEENVVLLKLKDESN